VRSGKCGVTETMPDLERQVSSRRKGCERADDRTGFLINDIKPFTRPVDNRVICPRRQLKIARILRPSVATPFFSDMKSELYICNNIDPWMRRCLSATQANDVLCPFLIEAPDTVPEVQTVAIKACCAGNSIPGPEIEALVGVIFNG